MKLLALFGVLVLVPTLSSLRPASVPPVQQSGQPGPPLIPLDILANHSALTAIAMTGSEWTNIETWSNNVETVNVGGNNSDHDVIALACALRWQRTGLITYREKARDYISDATQGVMFFPGQNHPSIDVLAIGRNVLSYVLAADLISLEQFDASLESAFRTWLGDIKAQSWSCTRTLREIHELRPNNEGLVAGASRIAIDMYLNTPAALQDLKDAKKVLHAWLGNTTQHSGFDFGGGNPPPPRDNSWQSTTDPAQYRGISPVGAVLGVSDDADGLMPDDQRRVGDEPCCNPVGDVNPSYPGCWGVRTNYTWEALQGAVMQAHLLARCGYPAFSWESAALKRAITWHYDIYGFPPETTGCGSSQSDDTWVPHITDKYYGTTRGSVFGGTPGKNCGFADWWSKGI